MSNVAPINKDEQKGGGLAALTPTNLDEAMRFAEIMSKSNIVPKDYQGQPGNVLVAVQWGMELGLQPLQAMQNIAVINGRPSIWGDSMLAIVQGSGKLEYITEDPTDEGCTCTVKRAGQPEVTREFTVEDAKAAGLYKKQGPWQQYPKRMMQMRARAFALRDAFADVLRGVSIAEEAQDEPQIKDITPKEEEPKKAKGAASVKDKVKARRKKDEAPEQPAAEGIIAKIEAAPDEAALKAATDDVVHIEDEAEKGRIRETYKARLAELRTAPGESDPDFDHQATYERVMTAIVEGANVDAAMKHEAEAIEAMKTAEPDLFAALERDVEAAKGSE